MNKKGFTLVELLAVIIILSLLITIAIPASQAIGKKINEKMLINKLDIASQSAKLWAVDNISCFINNVCSDKIVKFTCPAGTINNTNCYKIKLETLAEEKYYQYDDEINKKIINPANKTEKLNKQEIIIKYNTVDKTVIGYYTTTKKV